MRRVVRIRLQQGTWLYVLYELPPKKYLHCLKVLHRWQSNPLLETVPHENSKPSTVATAKIPVAIEITNQARSLLKAVVDARCRTRTTRSSSEESRIE